MTDIADIFRHLGKLCPVDSLQWENFCCARDCCAGLSSYVFSDGATLSVLSKKGRALRSSSTICVCTPFSKDVPVLYLRLDSNRIGARITVDVFDTCSCRSASLPNLEAVKNRFTLMLNCGAGVSASGNYRMPCSFHKFSLGESGREICGELCKDFVSCYADILSRRPSFCQVEEGNSTIVDRQQNLVDNLFFVDKSFRKSLFEGIKVPDFDDFIDFIHFCGIPHLKIDRALLV